MKIFILTVLLFTATNVSAYGESLEKIYKESIEKFLGYNCKDLSLESLIKNSDGIYIARVVNEFVPTEANAGKIRIQDQLDEGVSIQEAYISRDAELARQRYKVYEFEIVEVIKGANKGSALYKLPMLQNTIMSEKKGNKNSLDDANLLDKCWVLPKFKIGKEYLIFPSLFLHPEGNIDMEKVEPDKLNKIKSTVISGD